MSHKKRERRRKKNYVRKIKTENAKRGKGPRRREEQKREKRKK